MRNAKKANKPILVKGSVFDKTNKNTIINICIEAIQLFLLPYLLRPGIEKLSTRGAHKNFNE